MESKKEKVFVGLVYNEKFKKQVTASNEMFKSKKLTIAPVSHFNFKYPKWLIRTSILKLNLKMAKMSSIYL